MVSNIDVPDAEGAIKAGSDGTPRVAGETHAFHLAGVALEDHDHFNCLESTLAGVFELPDLHLSCECAHGDESPIDRCGCH
eukprot:scaffold652105_cov46-Prasinocladus_malaysianus.AAC.1